MVRGYCFVDDEKCRRVCGWWRSVLMLDDRGKRVLDIGREGICGKGQIALEGSKSSVETANL